MLFSEKLLSRLKNAEVVTALTGAGVSAESGVPTFRDPGGIWEKYRPEQLASFDAFINNPEFVWSWYQHRRKIMRNVKPNAGHYALAEMEGLFREFNLVTQNIDNLHSRAGSSNVKELHGNIERNYCIKCGNVISEVNLEHDKVLTCGCGGLIRPDVVWFGEMLPYEALMFAQDSARRSDVFFTIGTSTEVYPAAQLPLIAKRSGAYVVEVNIRPTVISREVDEVITGKSSEALSELVSVIKKEKVGD